MRTTKTLISLGGCPGWSESLLGAQVILLVLSCAVSNEFFQLYNNRPPHYSCLLPNTKFQCIAWHRPTQKRRQKGIWAVARQNQQNDMCAQRRFTSVWASFQSDQSLHCALNESLRTQGFFMRTAKALSRLGGRPGWPESSLGAQVILLVLSCGCSCDLKFMLYHFQKVCH